MMINITMSIIVHRSNGRNHLIQERIRRIRGNGRSQASTHEIGRKTAMITSERMEKHTRCIKMKSQRQIGRSLTILREIGRKMIMSQKGTKIMLQSMNRRSLNGQKMIMSQSTAKKDYSSKDEPKHEPSKHEPSDYEPQGHNDDYSSTDEPKHDEPSEYDEPKEDDDDNNYGTAYALGLGD